MNCQADIFFVEKINIMLLLCWGGGCDLPCSQQVAQPCVFNDGHEIDEPTCVGRLYWIDAWEAGILKLYTAGSA